MKILITGSSGFIGKNLVKALEKQHSVVKYDIKKGDNIFNKNRLEKKLFGCDAVIHLAALVNQAESWLKPYSYLKTNGLGTLCVLQAAKKMKVKRFIFLSSAAIYSKEITPYGLSKKIAEDFCKMYNPSLEIVVLRPFNLYGIKQNPEYNYAIHNFIKGIYRKQKIIIYGNGKQTRDFVYIDDLISIIKYSLTSIIPLKPIDIGTGNEITMNDLAAKIADIMQKPFQAIYLAKRREPVRSKADIKPLIEWGINPDKFLSLDIGLKKVIDYGK